MTWTLSGVSFDGGGTASGTFVYDADTNIFSSVDIVTTTGLEFAGATYTAVDPGFSPSAFELGLVTSPSLSDYTGTPVLGLGFFGGGTGLTDSGGTIGRLAAESPCANPGCTEVGTLYRNGEGVVSAAVATPEPSTWLLLGTGLLGAVVLSRKWHRNLESRLQTYA